MHYWHGRISVVIFIVINFHCNISSVLMMLLIHVYFTKKADLIYTSIFK